MSLSPQFGTLHQSPLRHTTHTTPVPRWAHYISPLCMRRGSEMYQLGTWWMAVPRRCGYRIWEGTSRKFPVECKGKSPVGSLGDEVPSIYSDTLKITLQWCTLTESKNSYFGNLVWNSTMMGGARGVHPKPVKVWNPVDLPLPQCFSHIFSTQDALC